MTETKQILSDWKFKSCDDREWLPAIVPGCVHTDLLHNGKIPNPFYGTHEGDLQWIDKKDWEYETTFDVSDELFNESRVNIVFAGLDTYADVYLNGHQVLSANNMFRTWQADVKEWLRARNNTLFVHFRSPIQEDLPKLEALGYALPAPNDQSERGGLGDKRLSVFARKAPYHYGWDWGPRFVTSGIWREVLLFGWTGSRVTDLFIQQKSVTTTSAQLTAVLEIESEAKWSGTLDLSSEGLQWKQEVTLEPGFNRVEMDFELANPKLWWSRGLGEPYLYEFTAALLEDEVALSKKSAKTGIRSIRLVQEKDDQGTSFYFELNGVPVFAKGANHIPNDSFLTDITYERYRHEVATAAESNMNMLRVWGGGIYEDEDFYTLCDEYGILVWQDFMFACSMYPGDEAFLENVRMEAEENVKRLRNHPSIALWCGNNEIDTGWSHYIENAGWGWKQQYTPELRDKLWHDYEAIFHNILPTVLSAVAPGADYWPSSPMKALTRDKDQHAANDSTMGDIHYWGVWHNVEPFSNYNVYLGRFMSEYGFQSFPELATVETYAGDEDMALESDVMKWHQRSGDGNRLIKEYMDIYSKEPKDFPSFLYMSQILQAEAIQSAMEAHRRKKPYCMGTLYWQINDCWPVASWSSMDYYGRWKALQYFAKRSYRDVAVSFDGTSGTSIAIHVISDVLQPISGSIHARLYDFSGALLNQISTEIEVSANSAQTVLALSVEDILAGHNPNEVVLVGILEHEGQVMDTKEHYFAPAKDILLTAPEITVHVVEGSQGTEFAFETNVLAKNVWVSSEVEGIFTDNFFDLVPGISKTIGFLARESGAAVFAPASPGTFTVRSMTDFIR